MRPRRYEAADMPEALRRIRDDLGPDAIILDCRPLRPTGLLGLLRRSRRGLEVWAAPGAPAWTDRPIPFPYPYPVPQPPVAEGAPAASLGEEIRASIARLEGVVAELTRSGRLGQLPGSLQQQHRRLIHQGLEVALADELVQAVTEELSPRALDSEDLVASATRRHLERRIAIRGPIQVERGRGKVVFLVGPTGVGKTTTLAKLAAGFALVQRKRVVLATMDTYRIAAVPQLRTYAEIMGLPMAVAYNPQELAELLARYADADLVLVDTPGRSHRRSDQIAELRAFREAAPTAEVYLTVAAPTRYEDMLEIAESFAGHLRRPASHNDHLDVHLDGLVLTKLDETTAHGAAVSLACRTGLPVAYLTTGQNVPEDLEVATSSRLAGLVVDAPDGPATVPTFAEHRTNNGLPNAGSARQQPRRSAGAARREGTIRAVQGKE